MLYNNFVNINVDNLNSNIDYIKNNYNYKYYILDVTNNAFNHGMYIINYLNNKIDYSYTTSFNDCVLIRKYNKDIPIIYSGLITKENIFDLIINNVIVVIKDKYIFKDIVNENIKDNLNVILNIDLDKYNGINSKYDILDILELIKDNKYINVTGIKAKVSEDNYDDFKYVISPLKDLQLIILNDENDKNKIKLSNSIKLDYSIYGFNNVKKNLFKKECLYLKQIFTLNSRVVNIAKEKKNKKDIIIGVISFGFNNGLLDKIKNVYINNRLYEIIEIKDEYTLILLDESVKVNDLVQISSSNNPIENYINYNSLTFVSLLNNNLPIIYDDYTLEKTYIY